MSWSEWKEIWLEPSCERCRDDGQERTWAEHDLYDPCAECGQKPARFTLADPGGKVARPEEDEEEQDG